MFEHTDEETVPCKRCGDPTPMLGTKLCNRCWELETRIGSSPEIALQIIMETDVYKKEIARVKSE